MWTIRVHQLVGKLDLKNIPREKYSIIFKAIYKKLSVDPKAFGKPLVGEFKGYWRLRINDYRVIYRIFDKEIIVEVIMIGPRKDNIVYQQLEIRLQKD